MNIKSDNISLNSFELLQDAISKENKSKDMYLDYWQRVREESARRKALSIRIITEKGMILDTIFLNMKKTYALKKQYERNLIDQWGGVIEDEKETHRLFHPSIEDLDIYMSLQKDTERNKWVYFNEPDLSERINFFDSYFCPEKKRNIYKRNEQFCPDLKLLTNPPYPDFCKNLLYYYVRSFSLHLKKGEPGTPLEIGFRHEVCKNTYEDLCIGLEILLPYMSKTENGKVVIHTGGNLSYHSSYSSILVNPKTGGAELVIYRKGRFDHRHKPKALESRKWLDEDRIIKEYPSIRIALLNIIACRYRQHFKNRDI